MVDEEVSLYDRNYFDVVLADRLRKRCEEGKKLSFLMVGISNYQEIKNGSDNGFCLGRRKK